jgi:Transglycosylase SLT domain
MHFWTDTRWFLLALILAPPGSTARASSDTPAALCVKAARSAAEQTAVPYDALLAIAVVETGRDLQPWPWTVNLGGDGHWLNSADEAAEVVQTALDGGLTNIDIGCFQLNYRWHASAFASLEEMLDPDRNALYAAAYLAELHSRTGDWSKAAAAYHSATPDHAGRYLARYEETMADLSAAGMDEPLAGTGRSNGFPLLIAGATGRNGSLVPATPGGLRLLGGE